LRQLDFPTDESTAKGRRIDGVAEIEAESQEVLDGITKLEVLRCFWQWQRRCASCIKFERDYSEGKNTDIGIT
jgi:hypothetical protein